MTTLFKEATQTKSSLDSTFFEEATGTGL